MSEPHFSPKISLITVVRNGARFIERCLQSIESQAYDNIEYIVLDGASDDGTQAILERYKHLMSHYESKPDKGAYDAATKALTHATGDIVGFVMADDWLAPDALATIADLYHNKPDAKLLCFAMQEHRQNEAGEFEPSRVLCDPDGDVFTLEDALYCQGLNRFYARCVFDTEPYVHTKQYPLMADRDFYLRLGRHQLPKAWTGKLLYHAGIHEGSYSTGGSAERVAEFLSETASIANHYLQDPSLSPAMRSALINWYCFNRLRGIWFLFKSGQSLAACKQALCLAMRYPLAVVRNVICWRMPKAYRAVAQ